MTEEELERERIRQQREAERLEEERHSFFKHINIFDMRHDIILVLDMCLIIYIYQ